MIGFMKENPGLTFITFVVLVLAVANFFWYRRNK